VSNEEQTSPEVENPEEAEQLQSEAEQDAVEEQEPTVESLQARVESLEEELVNTKDQALRTAAEAQNVRRRAEQETDKARKFALEKFSGSLLDVVDNLERAISSADRDNEALAGLLDGIDLTYKSFIDTLAKFQVEQLDPAGEPFDPQFHQAMTMVPNPDLEPNTVMDVMQKGYTLNGRLLRPAMVVVSKAAE
jgi:molecular chaperone GrpE